MDKARQLRWDLRYIELARTVAQWSKDPSTKVGAVLVRPNNSVASTGFNGFPPGHDDSPELYADREYKYQHVIHAEVNALNFLRDGLGLKPEDEGQPALGFTVYTSFPVCPDCMERLGEAGIARVAYPPINGVGKSAEWLREWTNRSVAARMIANRYGIQVRTVREA